PPPRPANSGRQGFSADASNAELEKRIKEIEDKEMEDAAKASLEDAKEGGGMEDGGSDTKKSKTG
ncbi:hypothetical protein TeGR_g1215, partial [Tetraparma gracilis]